MARKPHYRRGRRRKRGFATWSLGKKIAVILSSTLLAVLAIGTVILASKLSKIETTKLDAENLNISDEVEHETGYVNVALFGLDSRENDLGKGNRSDTIMIASLNRETKEVRLVSVFRDTLLELDDGSFNKANAAYSFGGPEAAVSMLNRNLDMNIEKYVTVNFNALVDVIDALGGLDVSMTAEEVGHMNNYCVETSKVTGKDYDRRTTTFGDQVSIPVKGPMSVYAAVEFEDGSKTYFPVLVKTDFPAGTVEAKMDSGSLWNSIDPGSIKSTITIKDGYNFKGFWQYYLDDNKWENPVRTLSLMWNYNEENKTSTATWDSNYGYWSGETRLVARLTADVNFHKYGKETPITVERKYDSLLFCTDESKVENWDDPDGSHVKTPDYGDITGKVVGTGITPSNDEMYRNGYKFIGWTTDEGIFTDKENYVVSSEAAVSGSLLNENTRVTETMDIYPVYLKYDITLKTNFGELPKGTIEESTTPGEEGSVIFTFTGDGYEFADPSEWTVKENGLEIDATIIKNGDNIYTIKGLNTETEYDIIASCKATVTFNNKNGSEVKKKPYDYNEELGELPKPTQEINSSETSISAGTTPEVKVEIFAGWKENSEYVTDKTLVTAPMNLHPEYVAPPSLECTIDDSDTKIVVSETGTATLVTSKEEGYEFVGWTWTFLVETAL